MSFRYRRGSGSSGNAKIRAAVGRVTVVEELSVNGSWETFTSDKFPIAGTTADVVFTFLYSGSSGNAKDVYLDAVSLMRV